MNLWLVLAELGVHAALGAVAVLLGGRIVLTVFDWAENSRAKELPAGSEERQAVAPLTAAASTLRGGQWIGMLERLAVFGALATGFPEGVAVAMVLKGLARYPELKATTSGAAERFIIGTFVSVLFACACAGISVWLTGLF